jgi:hypothetical protein
MSDSNKKISLKRFIIIGIFLIMGLIFLIGKKKYWVYISTSLIVGSVIAVAFVKKGY